VRLKLRLLAQWIVLAGLSLASIEAACQVAYRVRGGEWYFAARRSSPRNMLEPHPYLGLCLVPGVSEVRNGVRLTHNSFGCRGPEFARQKPAGTVRIAALGGSSTYCVGVSDDETWEYFLNRQLGTNFEVINMGLPGGASPEALIQSALLFSETKPDVALYYLGWNDAQVQHVQNLSSDWSESHGKLVMAQGLSGRQFAERTATGYFLKRCMFRSFFPGMDPEVVRGSQKGTPDALTDRIDLRALGLYERNLGLIAAICRKQGILPVFVPQILNYEALTSDQAYGWLPFVRDRDLKKVMSAYNASMAKVAKQEGAAFAREVLDVPYTAADFIDRGHFSRAGNQHFAAVLAGVVTTLLAASPQPRAE
jgi:hypothetical protein